MKATILEGVGPDDYHKRPGLSSSIATTLITRSPLHAWKDHPAFGGKDKEDDSTKAKDTGSLLHTLVLGAGKRLQVLDFPDYRTKKAQEARDEARDAGCVPVLAEQFLEATTAAGAIRDQLAARGINLDGRSELAVEWYEPSDYGDVLCRAMFDHVWLERAAILDLKITHNAAPTKVERSAEDFGYAIQAFAYRRALTALRPELAGRADFLFAFCEPEDPFAINLCRPDGMFTELGDRRWRRAVNTWGRCIAENNWPAFGTGVNYITSPVWALDKEENAA